MVWRLKLLDSANGTEEAPSLVILDVNLAKFSGDEVFRYILGHRECRQTPVLIVSTCDSAENRQRMRELGGGAHFANLRPFGSS